MSIICFQKSTLPAKKILNKTIPGKILLKPGRSAYFWPNEKQIR